MPIGADGEEEAFISLHDGSIALSDDPIDAVLAIRRRVLSKSASLSFLRIQALKSNEAQADAVYSIASINPDGTACSLKKQISVLSVAVLPKAKEQDLSSVIKEKNDDYHLRELVLPSNTEASILLENDESEHGPGEVIFFTEKTGPFQIVPTQIDDIVEIDRNLACR